MGSTDRPAHDAGRRALALILNATRTPPTVAAQLDISKLSADTGVAQVIQTLEDACLDDAADATVRDIRVPAN